MDIIETRTGRGGKVQYCRICHAAKMPPTYVYGQISLDFQLKDGPAKATFKYKYFAKDDALEYVGIEYSDPRLRDMIDGNAQVKERVDKYIRSLLARKKNG